MQVEFAFAASSAAAVAPHDVRFGGRARTGGGAASTMTVHPAGAGVRSGYDDENGRSRSSGGRAPKRTGIAASPFVVRVGTQLAKAHGGASTVFVTSRRARTVAVFHDGAVRAWGLSAGLTDAARSDAASSGGAGAGNGLKEGVMACDADMDGRRAVRACAAAHVTGS